MRAQLEAEWRYCGNEGEELTGNKVETAEQDKIALMLDPRTLIYLKKVGIHSPERETLLSQLESEYVKYARIAMDYQKKKEEVDTTQMNQRVETSPSGNSDDEDTMSVMSIDSAEYTDEDGSCMGQSGGSVIVTDRKIQDEFEKVYKAYKGFCKRIDWKAEFAELKSMKIVSPLDLWEVDVGKLFARMIKEDPNRLKYGYLPIMATALHGSVGAFLASSFCERINSVANLVVTDGNTLLADEEINMLVVLRMNRKFMLYMHKHHGQDHRLEGMCQEVLITEADNAGEDE